MANVRSEKRQMGRVISIRVGQELDDAIVTAADTQTRGDWIRASLASTLGLDNVRSGRKSAGRKRLLQAGREDIEVLRSLFMSTSRGVGMLKLFAAQMQVLNNHELQQEANITLKEMQLVVRELQAKLKLLDVV